VELNEGTVEVRNRESGPGAVYRVTLPIPEDTLLASARAEAAGVTSDWPSHRVLIVDDNRDAADTLALLFELDGHTIRLAHDGPSAVAEAHEFQPEVILMDIGLPGFSGNEAVRRIRLQESSVRPFVIALTGWGAPEDREATRAAGCDLHLTKPISHDELRRTIVDLTSGKEAAHGNG
jgi:CheY-like chemotaxis protein